MTAIAGCCGPSAASVLERYATCLLNTMGAYGTLPAIFGQLPGAAFGIKQSPLAQPDGDSPPVIEWGRFLCVADARIDNRSELARSLAVDQRSSDASLILAAWMKWRGDASERLLGDFAFAIFDRADRSLTIARDPSGERPLFFAFAASHCHFATMPAALIAGAGLWRGWNVPVLAAAQLESYNFDSSTYFAGVRRLYPGECLTIVDSEITAGSAWYPRPARSRNRTDHDYVEEYRHILEESVGSRLRRPSGRIASHLSSGWDSSAVAATAARLAPRCDPPLIAVTSAPPLAFQPHPSLRLTVDESVLASLTARAYGMEHVVIRTTDSALSRLREDSRFFQEPHRNIVNTVWYAEVAQAARDRGASVILSGQSGNLTLNSGGVESFAQFINQREWRKWWREASLAARIGEVRWKGILYNSFRSRMPSWGRRWLERQRFGVMPRERFHFLRPQHASAALARFSDAELASERGSDHDQRLHRILGTDNGLFRKGILAAHGIDERDPTGDQRLIRFGVNLPTDQMLRDGVLRPMARRALADRLPAEILANPRRGMQGADWFNTIRKAEVADLIEEVASNRTVDDLFDIARLRRMVDDWPARNDGSFGLAQRYQQKLPLALSTAVFIIEMERLAGSALS